MQTLLTSRKSLLIAATIALVLVAGTWAAMLLGTRKPPSIFDAPADDVAGYLVTSDFSGLTVEQRTEFLAGLLERFRSMSQSESAVVAAFFAGMAGDMREQLRQNVRILGKDILVQGAEQYFALKTESERSQFIDQWVVKWARYADQAEGRRRQRTDQEILDRLNRQATRDAERGLKLDAHSTQQLLDFWESEVATVASPAEQGQIFQFLPAVQKRVLRKD